MKENQYLKIMQAKMKHHFGLPVLTAVGVFFVTALMFNLSALTAKEAARPIELFLSFTGVMLLTPVFYPEQNHDLRDVISAKKVSYLVVCALRLVYSVMVLAVLVFLFVLLLKWNESAVTDAHLFGGIATAVFLGAVGCFAAGVTDNTTLGYMAAMLYYLLNYGAKQKLGKFYLFYMSSGEFEEKWWLFLGAAVLCFLTFFVMILRRKKSGY